MSDEHRWARFVEETIKARNLHEPPRDVLRRAIALGQRLQRPSAASVFDHVRLLFDSAAAPLPVGVRSGASGPRRLLYGIGSKDEPAALELDLQVRRRAGGGVDLTGQLLPPLTNVTVELIAGTTRKSAEMGVAGEFQFRNVRASAPVAEIRFRSERPRFAVTDVPLDGETDGPS